MFKKLFVGLLVTAMVGLSSSAFAGFCGWEVAKPTRECTNGMYFECRVWCNTFMSSTGQFVCICSSECEYLGQCWEVVSTGEDLTLEAEPVDSSLEAEPVDTKEAPND